jgi:hypothetical protein
MSQEPPKTHQLNVNVTQGQKVSLYKTVTNTLFKKNWPLVLLYILLCFGGAVASYYVPGIGSFCISIVFSVIETIVGLFAIVKVIQITKEVCRPD